MTYSYTGVPIINGVALPRPTSVTESSEDVGATVTLAGGSERRYDQGERFVVTLSWAKMSGAEVSALRGAAGRGLLAYVHLDGVARTVRRAGPPSVDPVAATDPVVFAVSITLRSQDPAT